MEATRITPTAALEVQDALVKFWRSERGAAFMQGWNEIRHRDGLNRFIEVPEHRAGFEMQTLAGARTYLVTEEMTEVAMAAARSMPDEPLLETDLPTPSGFLMFERALVFPDIREQNVAMLAIAWRRCVDSSGVVGIVWTYYSDLHDMRDVYNSKPESKHAREAWPTRAILLAEDTEKFGAGTYDPKVIAAHYPNPITEEVVKVGLAHMHALPLALFALMRSQVTDVAEENASRAARRRLERAACPIPDGIRVIRLRRVSHSSVTPGDESVSWSHRWLVSGHWRRAWRPSVKQHRLVWIHPFIKGPDDKPFKARRSVHVLER